MRQQMGEDAGVGMGFFDGGHNHHRPVRVKPHLIGSEEMLRHFDFDQHDKGRGADQQVRHPLPHPRQRQHKESGVAVRLDNGLLVLVEPRTVSHDGEVTVPVETPNGRVAIRICIPFR